MKQTVNSYQFREAFVRMDRTSQFSYTGLNTLFDYLEELEDSIGEEIELDVIAICCEFAEDTPEEIARAYNYDIEGCTHEEALDRVVDALNNDGAYIGQGCKLSDGSQQIIYRKF